MKGLWPSPPIHTKEIQHTPYLHKAGFTSTVLLVAPRQKPREYSPWWEKSISKKKEQKNRENNQCIIKEKNCKKHSSKKGKKTLTNTYIKNPSSSIQTYLKDPPQGSSKTKKQWTTKKSQQKVKTKKENNKMRSSQNMSKKRNKKTIF